MERRRPPIRDEIRHAAERHQPVTLTPDEVEEIERDLEELEARWSEKESAA
ncbi:hypothetical protein [Azospirillum sp. TSA2s]|uniref:hypothetical protein n=1 Tax=Azospirillum sp. TSA2s TaxID=709810 RepID=UPI00145B3EFF|nr:hypothetical protein [Azospirillum sp. TSA2s]